MNATLALAVVSGTVAAATPLVYAALGELLAERAGVLNLGVEGMMLVGAVSGFAVIAAGGSLVLGYAAAAAAGVSLASLFAVLTLSLRTNQVATGLALTLFGAGASALAGRRFVGATIARVPPVHIPVLSELPLLGPLLFHYDAVVYLSWVLCASIAWMMNRTRLGLKVRAVGESPAVAYALGLPVMRLRYGAVLAGGGLSGLAGAYLSTAVTPMWVEGLSAGRGWIALALVVFGTWRPWRVMGGAYLFGAVSVLQLQAQAVGVNLPAEFLSMLPYVATIGVLAVGGRNPRLLLLNKPASLGAAFHPP